MRMGIASARLSLSSGTVLGGLRLQRAQPQAERLHSREQPPSACRNDIEAEDLPRAVQAGGRGGSAKREFRLGEALAYMANMRTFWMITVGLGEPALLPRLPCVLAPCSIETSSNLATPGLGHLRTAALGFWTALGQRCLIRAT